MKILWFSFWIGEHELAISYDPYKKMGTGGEYGRGAVLMEHWHSALNYWLFKRCLSRLFKKSEKIWKKSLYQIIFQQKFQIICPKKSVKKSFKKSIQKLFQKNLPKSCLKIFSKNLYKKSVKKFDKNSVPKICQNI